jgi:hypothetical protein
MATMAPCPKRNKIVQRGNLRLSAKPSCSDCYFRRAGLCALPGETPCPTFRAVVAGGQLQPPRQPRLVIRQAGPLVSAPAL